MRKLLLSSLLVTIAGNLGCAPPDNGTGGGGSNVSGVGRSTGGGGGSTGGGGGSSTGGGGGGTGGGSTGGGGGTADAGAEITVFARDLILNHTANDNGPTTTEDKGLIDVSPITFGPGFFP